MGEKPSLEVIIERLDTLILSNNNEHHAIKLQIEDITQDHEKRIRDLENWKLVFVAKFSVYASLGVFMGTLAGQLIVKFIIK